MSDAENEKCQHKWLASDQNLSLGGVSSIIALTRKNSIFKGLA
jgi:hypothetical protein